MNNFIFSAAIYPLKDFSIKYIWDDPNANTAEIAQLCLYESPDNAYYISIKQHLFCFAFLPPSEIIIAAPLPLPQGEDICSIEKEACQIAGYNINNITGVDNFVFTELSPFIVGQENMIRFEGKNNFQICYTTARCPWKPFAG